MSATKNDRPDDAARAEREGTALDADGLAPTMPMPSIADALIDGFGVLTGHRDEEEEPTE